MSAIHWFRKGLRLHDNPALIAALKPFEGEPLTLRPVFVLDPWFLKSGNVGDNRWRFLQQTLVDLEYDHLLLIIFEFLPGAQLVSHATLVLLLLYSYLT